MPLNPNDSIAVADINAACRRLKLGDSQRAAVLADYRDRGPHLLAASVLVHAMTHRGDPATRSRSSAADGARLYAEMLLAPAVPNRPDPGEDFDWPAGVARACNRLGLSPVDRAYVLGRLDGEGSRSVAAWVELAASDPGRALYPPADPSPGASIRKGCGAYARACLWLRDHRPATPHLTVYGAAG